jgi:hypothetical protein
MKRHISEDKEETVMAKEGDTMKAHCGTCQQETTWIYQIYMLGKEIWECMGCRKRRYV